MRIILFIALMFFGLQSFACEVSEPVEVKYGDHRQQNVVFYQAKSDKPTPVVFYVHGSHYQGGDTIDFLEHGISVVTVHYRTVPSSIRDNIELPVKASMDDVVRALQFVRSKAADWNVDKTRIGITGGTRGGLLSLWLAFHDDMADAKSDDPVARESTRLYCAAVIDGLVTLDPQELRQLMPDYDNRSTAYYFRLTDFQSLIDNRAKILPVIKEYSPIEHVTMDDPPIAIFYGEKKPAVAMGDKLEKRLKDAGVDVVRILPDQDDSAYQNATEYLIDRLLK